MTSWTAMARLGVRGLGLGLLGGPGVRVRDYSRAASRRPVRVLRPGEDSDSDGPAFGRLRPVVEERAGPDVVGKAGPVGPPEVGSSSSEEASPETLGGKPSRLPPGFPRFENKGTDDGELCRLALDSTNKKSRQKSGLIMLEGKRLIQEAFNARLEPRALFFSRVSTVTSMQFPSKTFSLQKVTYEKIKRWSKLETPPGVIGFFKLPDVSKNRPTSALPYSIICDNIREPGNLGSILRTAASAGCKTVFLSKGCVDLWNDKVLRSAMGAHFHMHIQECTEWGDIEAGLEPDSYILFADSQDKDLTSTEEIIQGNASIESDLEDAETEDSQGERVRCHSNTTDDRQEVKNLPVFPYYLVDYSQMSGMYLVIGGETGFSKNACKFGKSHKKLRLNIPMLNNVESLGVSSATAILAHEIKRQYEIGEASHNLLDEDTVSVPNA